MERTYRVEVEGRDWAVTICEEPDGIRIRLADGDEQRVDFTLVGDPGLYSLLLGDKSHEIRVVPDREQHGQWQVEQQGRQFTVHVQTEREHRLSRVTGAQPVHSGDLTVKAPMPGLVRAVIVKTGETVQQGQRLLLLEAMKMENEIQAPRAGTVKEIKVAPGDTVENGRPLVILG